MISLRSIWIALSLLFNSLLYLSFKVWQKGFSKVCKTILDFFVDWDWWCMCFVVHNNLDSLNIYSWFPFLWVKFIGWNFVDFFFLNIEIFLSSSGKQNSGTKQISTVVWYCCHLICSQCGTLVAVSSYFSLNIFILVINCQVFISPVSLTKLISMDLKRIFDLLNMSITQQSKHLSFLLYFCSTEKRIYPYGLVSYLSNPKYFSFYYLSSLMSSICFSLLNSIHVNNNVSLKSRTIISLKNHTMYGTSWLKKGREGKEESVFSHILWLEKRNENPHRKS